MTTDNLLIAKNDPDTERRRALAKVYSLLFHLAEEAESKTTEAVRVEIDPSTDEDNSMTLKENIPP